MVLNIKMAAVAYQDLTKIYNDEKSRLVEVKKEESRKRLGYIDQYLKLDNKELAQVLERVIKKFDMQLEEFFEIVNMLKEGGVDLT